MFLYLLIEALYKAEHKQLRQEIGHNAPEFVE
jgi:hypothetical protein